MTAQGLEFAGSDSDLLLVVGGAVTAVAVDIVVHGRLHRGSIGRVTEGEGEVEENEENEENEGGEGGGKWRSGWKVERGKNLTRQTQKHSAGREGKRAAIYS